MGPSGVQLAIYLDIECNHNLLIVQFEVSLGYNYNSSCAAVKRGQVGVEVSGAGIRATGLKGFDFSRPRFCFTAAFYTPKP